MLNLRIGIVEDDELIAESICQLLLSLGYDVLEPVASYAEGVKMLEQYRPDFVILDIRLGNEKIDGIRLAEFINEKYIIPFIFLTANADKTTVSLAKKTAPAAFLVKPFSKADLFATIEVAIAKHVPSLSYSKIPFLFLKDGDRFRKVLETEILYVESNHVYLDIYTTDKKMVIRSTVDDFLQQLSPERFYKISRSYIVNIHHIDSFNSEFVEIKGTSLNISKTYQSGFMKKMQERGNPRS
jgi:two-component system, LytTR family, response regulator LytT